jgi:predicted GNAT family N-acyltransferase
MPRPSRRVHLAPQPPECAEEAADLLEGAYWLAGISRAEVVGAIRNSTLRIGGRSPEGRLVAFARALSDRHRVAWVYDVIVDKQFRSGGVGQALMASLLAHQAIRRVRTVRLTTRDAMTFYERFEFRSVAQIHRDKWIATEMVLSRPADGAHPNDTTHANQNELESPRPA